MELFGEESHLYGEDFGFAIEMIILKRKENGATLLEIRDDIEQYFGVNCEAIWGYQCMEQYFRPMLSNGVLDVDAVKLDGGCILYYIDIDAAIRKLSSDLSEPMTLILDALNIELRQCLDELKEAKKARDEAASKSRSASTNYISQSDSNSFKNTKPKSQRNGKPRLSRKSTASVSENCDIYGHVLIGDNFFLDLARIELCRQYSRKRLKQVGQCISGQSINRAVKNISSVINTIHHRGAVINLGSVDLLQGREVVDMMQDMLGLCKLLSDKGIFTIVVTIPPLANQMHNESVENKRKLFNEFLKDNFDYIDIQGGFYSSVNRVAFSQYERDARRVGGTKCPLVLWSNVARQRVFKKLKVEIPHIHAGHQ